MLSASNVCVESTARDGLMMDAHVVLVEDCCAAYDQSLYPSAAANMAYGFGDVVTGDDVIQAWVDVKLLAGREIRV